MKKDTPPPHNLEIERYVLGVVLYVGLEAMDEAMRFVTSKAFYLQQHSMIFSAMERLYERGETDLTTVGVREELRSMGNLSDVGGDDYLRKLEEEDFIPSSVGYYAKLVRGCHKLRLVIDVGNDLVRLGSARMDDTQIALDADSILADAQEQLFDTFSESENLSDKFIGKILPRTMARIVDGVGRDGGLSGLPTGYPSLDEITGGFNDSELVVVAARPGGGKTAMLCNFSRSVAMSAYRNWVAKREAGERVPQIAPKGVFVFSLEQSEMELVQRMLSAEAKVSGHRIRKGTIGEREGYLLTEASGKLEPLPLLVDGKPHQTVSSIASAARRAKRKYDIGMILIDYLGLIEPENAKALPEQQVAIATRRLKVLAKELSIPVVLLAQLSRETVKREDKRPRLSDLRGSGAIEQDADAVMFVHRPEEFDSKDRPGEADLIIAKNRGGPKGTVPLVWMPEFMRFGEKTEAPVLPEFKEW